MLSGLAYQLNVEKLFVSIPACQERHECGADEQVRGETQQSGHRN